MLAITAAIYLSPYLGIWSLWPALVDETLKVPGYGWTEVRALDRANRKAGCKAWWKE